MIGKSLRLKTGHIRRGMVDLWGVLLGTKSRISNEGYPNSILRVSGSVKPATVLPPQAGDGKYCTLCAEKAASELGKLTEKIIELKLEADRQQVQFNATKRKLDNTSKELKTAQAMIVTLKSQNTEKADRIAKLTREATIGLWEREKRKLLQFADVREASLEIELGSLKETSEKFRNRALDRIAFLHDQVYKLKLKLSLTNQAGKMTRALETAEKRLSDTQKELNGQREQFFKYKQSMVGMLAGFRKDFSYLTSQVDPKTYEANSDFFDHAETFDVLLEDLHKSALTDKLNEKVDSIPDKFTLPEGQQNEMRGRFALQMAAARTGSRGSSSGLETLDREGSMSNEEVLRQLENIEQALEAQGQAIKDYDLHDINDSGISLNEYETHSELTRETPLSGISKSVRFEDEDRIAEKWQKRRSITTHTSEKYVQTEAMQESSPPMSRKGKRNRRTKSSGRDSSASRTPTPTKKKTPKKIDAAARAQREAELQKQWLDGKKTPKSGGQKKKKLEKEKSRQNTITFTHLRDLYGERKVSSLIDRVTGAVDIETAAEQFPNLPRTSIVEGFSQFVQFDGNNDYRLDIGEVIRAISRISDQVIEAEEVKLVATTIMEFECGGPGLSRRTELCLRDARQRFLSWEFWKQTSWISLISFVFRKHWHAELLVRTCQTNALTTVLYENRVRPML
eukprot:sb/3462688/